MVSKAQKAEIELEEWWGKREKELMRRVLDTEENHRTSEEAKRRSPIVRCVRMTTIIGVSGMKEGGSSGSV
jgi:hypothetical protein